jgi:putative phosphoesterase
MRIAIISDIHGNCVALDAVLADLGSHEREEVDEYWILGDLAAAGAQPLEVMERVLGLANARFVRGNSERYLTTGARPLATPIADVTDAALMRDCIGVLESFAWTAGAITAGGHLPFMLGLPLEERLALPNGSRVLLVHASPGRDDGDGFVPWYEDGEMRARLKGCDADLVCVGHTHWPQNFHLDGVHVVNPGSVGNPQIPSLRATYAVLEADEDGYRVEHRAVAYDKRLAEQKAREAQHPQVDFIVSFLRGERTRSWGEPEVL